MALDLGLHKKRNSSTKAEKGWFKLKIRVFNVKKKNLLEHYFFSSFHCFSCEMRAIATFERMFTFLGCLGENVMMIGDNDDEHDFVSLFLNSLVDF